MIKYNLPTITILTGTLNSNVEVFKEVLDSIRSQDYPKKLIEHIVLDGGSINETVPLAKKYGCKVIIRSDLQSEKEHGQSRGVIGIKMAKGDLILILESDNILTSRDWLRRMVEPFLTNKKVICTFSAYNSYEKYMSATTRYTALFGSPDPTLYYLNKTEKIRMDQKKYNKRIILKETNDYYIVKFTTETLPTLGDNGHIFLKKAMLKVIKDEQNYIHVDAFSELLDMGYDTFGVVKNSLIHVQNPNIITLVKRRVEVKKIFYDQKRGKRKYLVFNPNSMNDRINLIKYILFSLTFIIPIMESIRGYIKIRDKAWFLHPVFCFLMVSAYGWSEVKRGLKDIF